MKTFLIVCLLLSCVYSIAQTSNDVTLGSADKVTIPKLEDIHVVVDSEGRFKTFTGTVKQMSTLKVSDLPNSNDPPLALESTVKCLTFEAMVVENEKRGGAFARMVPPEVLAAVPAAAASCLARNIMGLRENMHDFVIADVGAMVDAQAELDRRQYNELVKRYNDLVARHNKLLAMTQNLAGDLAVTQTDLARQQRINRALALYKIIPEYRPPQKIDIEVTDCTRLPALCVH